MLLVLIMDLIWQHAKYENNIYRLIHLHTHSYVNTIPAEASLLGHRGIPLASLQKKIKINRRHIDKSVTFWSEDDGFNKLSWPLTTESGVKKLNIISILLISGFFYLHCTCNSPGWIEFNSSFILTISIWSVLVASAL